MCRLVCEQDSLENCAQIYVKFSQGLAFGARKSEMIIFQEWSSFVSVSKS